MRKEIRKPNEIYWDALGTMITGCLVCAISSGLLTYVLFFFTGKQQAGSFIHFGTATATVMTFITTVIFLAVMVLMPVIFSWAYPKRERDYLLNKNEMLKSVKTGWALIKFGNPLIFPFYFVGSLMLGLWFDVKYIWRKMSLPSQ